MEATPRAAQNPLAQAAAVVPTELALWLGIAARVAGAGLAIIYAFDQSYDRTQVFTVVLAVLAVLSLVPLRPSLETWAASLASGLLLFSGAVLAHEVAGVGMLVMGALGWIAAAHAAYRRGVPAGTAVSGLFLSAGATFGLIVLVLLLVEG